MFKSPPKDLRIEVERITGFYRGVVEDLSLIHISEPTRLRRSRMPSSA